MCRSGGGSAGFAYREALPHVAHGALAVYIQPEALDLATLHPLDVQHAVRAMHL